MLSQSTGLDSSTIAYKWPDGSLVTQPGWQDVFDKSCLLKLKATSQVHFRRQILLEPQFGAGLKILVGPKKSSIEMSLIPGPMNFFGVTR